MGTRTHGRGIGRPGPQSRVSGGRTQACSFGFVVVLVSADHVLMVAIDRSARHPHRAVMGHLRLWP